MQPKIYIIGGGIAGLIMGYALSKRGFGEYAILESAPSEADLIKHSHIYYIHNIIEDIKHLLIEKPIQPYVYFRGEFYDKSTPLMCNLYSSRIIQKSLPSAIHHIDGSKKTGWFPESGNLEDIIRFYLKGQKGTIEYGTTVSSISLNDKSIGTNSVDARQYDTLINTIPLPILLKMAKLKTDVKFNYAPIHTYRAKLSETQDLFQELYIPEKTDSGFYRFLVYHNTAIAESTERLDAPVTETRRMMEKLGLVASSLENEPLYWPLPNGRFIPVDTDARKAIIRMLTDKHNIFSFGRYGTWSYKRTDHLPPDAEELIDIIKAKGTTI